MKTKYYAVNIIFHNHRRTMFIAGENKKDVILKAKKRLKEELYDHFGFFAEIMESFKYKAYRITSIIMGPETFQEFESDINLK